MIQKKKDLLTKVYNALLTELPNTYVLDQICFDRRLIDRLIRQINDKKICYPSVFLRFFERNKIYFKKMIEDKTEPKAFQKKEAIKNLIKNGIITPSNLSSIRNNEKIGKICNILGKKCSLKNKINIYYYCKRYFKNKSVSLTKNTFKNTNPKQKYSKAIIKNANDFKKDQCNVLKNQTENVLLHIDPPLVVEQSDEIIKSLKTPIKDEFDLIPMPKKTEMPNSNISINKNINTTNFELETTLKHPNNVKQEQCKIFKYLSQNNPENVVLDPSLGVEQSDKIPKILRTPIKDEFGCLLPTPEKIEMSNIILNFMDEMAPSNNILPLNTQNVLSLAKTTSKDCKIVEGSCSLKTEHYELVVKQNKLNPLYYPFVIKKYINFFINNTCILILKDKSYLKNGTIKLYATCKHDTCKKFVIVLKLNEITLLSSSRNFCHKHMITAYVKGAERLVTKQVLLEKKPSQYKKESILKAKRVLVTDSKNLQNIKSDSTIRKIRSEAISHLDRDKNDLLDLIQMQRDHPEYVQEISVPFSIKTFSKEQLYIILRQNVGNLPALYFDATGTVVRKSHPNDKRIYLYSGVVPLVQTKRIVPIFEMVSSSHFSKDIFKIFYDFKVFCEDQSKWPVFGSVVTDFSFANIHAISKACNGISLTDYLKQCFEIICGQIDMSKSLITIHLCCAHFLKMVSNDVNREFSDISIGKILNTFIAHCIKLDTLAHITEWFSQLTILLKSPCFDQMVKMAHENLISAVTGKNNEIIETTEIIAAEINRNDNVQSLYKSSPFYLHFNDIEKNTTGSDKGPPNPYFNPSFLSIVLTKYMPYVPLWSALLLNKNYGVDRFSNCYVENYFKDLKINILKGEKNLKASRFLRRSRENVLAKYKELALDIPTKKLTKLPKIIDPNAEKNSQERWNKKAKRTTTHFSGAFLKNEINLPIIPKIDTIVINDENEPFDLEKCIYCNAGRLAEQQNTDWVSCDDCKGWVHQKCVSPTKREFSTLAFVCSICTGTLCSPAKKQKLMESDFQYNELFKNCSNFIAGLKEINDVERDKIEIKTREQRNSVTWKEERKKELHRLYLVKFIKRKLINLK